MSSRLPLATLLLAVLDGNPAVVLFWATWCPYCKAFMPWVGDIQNDYADQGVQIVAINAKEQDEGDPVDYLDSLGISVVGVLEGADVKQSVAAWTEFHR